MDTADSRPPDTAERLFAEFLNGTDRARTIDELAAAHPELADRLYALAAGYAAGNPDVAGADAADAKASRARTELAQLLERLRRRGPDGNRYRLRDRLGVGGMGEVSAAHDEDLRRDFAIKQLGKHDREGRNATPTDPDSQLRFVAEAQTIGQLEHPGIPPVHEIGMQPDGRLYFAMRRVRGQPLARLLEAQPAWPQARLLAIVQKVCETMAYAHRRGVIHRDLKPDNVMVGEFGEVYVIDWGLARAIGDPDPEAEVVRTVRTPHPKAGGEPGEGDLDPGLTRAGTIVGTPNFMAPEQAIGDSRAVDKSSDIYSVGAMLYQLITGSLPYGRGAAEAIVAAVCAGPPPSPGSLAEGAPKDLLAICDRAMARRPADRYATMQELADDLRLFLEGHAVVARKITLVGRAWKWARRNRALATTGSLAVAAIVIATVAMQWGLGKSTQAAELQAVLSRTEAELGRATPPSELPAVLASSISTLQVDSLQQALDELIAAADELWPADPKDVPRLAAWEQRARGLIAGQASNLPIGDVGRPGLADLQTRLEQLRSRALPRTAAIERLDATSHPRFDSWRSLQAKVAWSARMLGHEPWPPPRPESEILDGDSVPTQAEDLRILARHLGDPGFAPYGEEARAAALIARAMASATPEEQAPILATKAFVQLKNGDLGGAQRCAEDALAAVTEANREIVTAELQRFRAALALWTEGRPERERQHAEWVGAAARLEQEVKTPRTFQFADFDEQQAHDRLARLVAGLQELTHPERGQLAVSVIDGKGPSVAARLRNARRIESRTISGPDAVRGWGIAIPAIKASSHYGGLEIRPQLGLLPLGEDPESGLWVFWHLSTGGLPRQDGQGRWTPNSSDGITLVLVPGGRFQKGAQRAVLGAPNHDADARAVEGPVREETVEPFFLAKHELTQAQWWLMTGARPSAYGMSAYDPRWNRKRDPWDGLLPVERVSWHDCARMLPRAGLTLPSDTQWEYAYRAGTDTPFPTGTDPRSLAGHANLADRFGNTHGLNAFLGWLDDGHGVAAAIGSFSPNAWGLHDMTGNVSEWLLDMPSQPGRTQRDMNPAERRARGGHWQSLADLARSAHWSVLDADTRSPQVGVRAARALDR